MQTAVNATPNTDVRYGRCLENSRKIRWDIDKDIIRGRDFDYSGQFLPDGLSMISRLTFLSAADARLLSQIQGRTYANIFGLVERWINARCSSSRASTGWAIRSPWRPWWASARRSSSIRSCSAASSG